jgi:hypothetical protein
MSPPERRTPSLPSATLNHGGLFSDMTLLVQDRDRRLSDQGRHSLMMTLPSFRRVELYVVRNKFVD